MDKKKILIFKFFDKYCVGDLVPEIGNEDWLQPTVDTDSLGYAVEHKALYYNGNIGDQVKSIFSVTQREFQEYFGDWFEDRHKLDVLLVL
jgi:hypothetical protein